MLFFGTSSLNLEENNKLSALYLKYHKQMWYMANSILKNEYEAEDVVHDTFFQVSKHLDKLTDIDSKEVRNYLLTAVKNRALILCNSKQHKFYKDLRSIDEYEKSVSGNLLIDNTFDESESFQSIINSIKNLKEIYRDVLYLFYVEELNVAEISRLLNRNYTTVRKQLKVGNEKLLKSLKNQGVISDD